VNESLPPFSPERLPDSLSQRALLETVCNNASVSLFVMNAQHQCVYMNPAAEALTGFTLAEVSGRMLHEVLHHSRPDGTPYPMNECPIGRACAHNARLRGEEVFVHKAGHFYPVAYMASPIWEGSSTIGTILEVRDLTADRLAEQASRESSERFQIIAKATNDAIWDWNLTTNKVWWNDGLAEMFGHDPESINEFATWWYDHIHPSDRDRVVSSIHQTIDGGLKHWQDRYRFRRADGEYAFIHDRGYCIHDSSGKAVRMVGAMLDITRQKQDEAILRDQAQRLDLALAAAHLGDWSWSTETDSVVLSPRAADVFGLDAEQAVTWTDLRNLLHEEDAERARLAVEKALNDGSDYAIEYRLLTDGETKWIAAHGRGRYDDTGRVNGMVGVVQDITIAKKATDELAASEQRLRAVLEATPECVKIVDRDGSLLYMNPAGLNMVQAERAQQVQGACVFDLIASEFRPEWRGLHDRVCSGERLSWEFEIVGLQGMRRWMETHAVPLQLPDRSTVQLAVTREITERKRNEAEKEKLLEAERTARSEAERANRLKDEFLSTVSHELRTPLTAILGWTQLLGSGKLPPEEVAEGIEVIERNVRVQTKIIEDLLDMSRILSGKIRLDVQPTPLPPVIEAAIASVRPAFEAKMIRVQTVLDPLAGPVMGDGNRLQQVIWNLLSNAIKFTPKGGRVQVTLERVNSHIELTVSDTGQGVRSDFLPYVFERFRQEDSSTTRVHGGLGLGLAIVKHLVELHGGTVRAKSAGEGQGATFIVNLPVAPVQAVNDSSRIHPSAETSSLLPLDGPSLEGVRVLVVDDEPDGLNIVRRILTEFGADVTTAASAREGLLAFQKHRPNVVLSDIGMPHEDGYDFIRSIRALGRASGGAVPAAAITAFARSEDRRRAMLAGYQTHLSKPVEPAELVAVVAALAGRVGELREGS